jgi:hypothetical protein
VSEETLPLSIEEVHASLAPTSATPAAQEPRATSRRSGTPVPVQQERTHMALGLSGIALALAVTGLTLDYSTASLAAAAIGVLALWPVLRA